MNISEFIFDSFNKKGIDTVFMVTGGQAMYLNDAVGKNSSYKIICTHHEQSAAMSSDAYGRIKNKPAITLVTAGPGALNAVNGVVGGYTDSSPMIVISGQANLSFVQYQQKTSIRQFGVQGINIKPVVENIVKYFVTIDNPAKVESYLSEAFEKATTGRPGPVWIEVPLDMQRAEIDAGKQEKYVSQKTAKDEYLISEAVDIAMEKLKSAKRPVFLVGQGVSLAGARESFSALLEKLRIPVITARLGIDLVETDNELYVGRPGNYGERAANFGIQNADLIISIGCRLASSLVGHAPEQFGKHAYKIVIDIDEEELKKPGVRIDHKAKIDCKDFIDALAKKIEGSDADFSEWIKQCNYWKKNYPVVQPEYKDENPVNSYYFIDKLSQKASSNANIMIDTGSCFHVACQTWKIKKGQHFLTTGGISSMGYWCAGIGACMANDKKETIVVTGDGSLQMNIQEFATIRHNNLPIKVFILNNNGYLLIRHTQRNFMNDRFVGESPANGVWCPDAMAIAQAYGIKGVRISSADEIDSKLDEVFAFAGPVICEVMTPEWQLLVPRITSEKLPDGRLVAREYSDMFPFLPKEEYERNMVAEGEKKDTSKTGVSTPPPRHSVTT